MEKKKGGDQLGKLIPRSFRLFVRFIFTLVAALSGLLSSACSSWKSYRWSLLFHRNDYYHLKDMQMIIFFLKEKFACVAQKEN